MLAKNTRVQQEQSWHILSFLPSPQPAPKAFILFSAERCCSSSECGSDHCHQGCSSRGGLMGQGAQLNFPMSSRSSNSSLRLKKKKIKSHLDIINWNSPKIAPSNALNLKCLLISLCKVPRNINSWYFLSLHNLLINKTIASLGVNLLFHRPSLSLLLNLGTFSQTHLCWQVIITI